MKAFPPTLVVFLVVLMLPFIATAQEEQPVGIAFDNNSHRIDIVSGRTLPEYTAAQRGSFLFYNDRLDNPDGGFWYFFDGRRFQGTDNLAFIRHSKSIGCWIMGYRGSDGRTPTTHPQQNCEILHHAVSFIPLNTSTGEPEPRVYVLLEDIHLIQWAPYDHWLATVSQEDFESRQGTVY